MKSLVLIVCLVVIGACVAETEERVQIDSYGHIDLFEEGHSFSIVSVEPGWHKRMGSCQFRFTSKEHEAAVKAKFLISPTGLHKGRLAEGRLTLDTDEQKRAHVRYAFSGPTGHAFEVIMLSGHLSNAFAAGGFLADGKPFAPSKDKMQIERKTRVFDIFGAGGVRAARVTFAAPTLVVARLGASEIELRFVALRRRAFAPREKVLLDFTVDAGRPMVVARNRGFVIQEGADWVLLEDLKDIIPGSALDFSMLEANHAPAGKFGWTKNVDGRFVFENLPNENVRFAGANLCFTANYPHHDEAERLVRRLKAIGYNSIRLHHHDGILFKKEGDGLAFDSEMLDRLDYLVAKAIKNGLYVTTDLYVSRPVTWRQIGRDLEGSPASRWFFKVMIAFDEGCYRNWYDHAAAFLNHVNPYTGRAYKDEPGMPLLSMVNEASYRMAWSAVTKDDVFLAKWRAWADAKRAQDPDFAKGEDLRDPARLAWSKTGPRGSTALATFMGETEEKNFARQLADMRALGAKQLFTSINHLPQSAPLQATRRKLYGYFDDHLYVEHPKFPDTAWRFPMQYLNINPLQDPENRVDKHVYMRLEGLPMTFSEYNYAGVGAYRGMGGLLAGVQFAGHDTAGYWRFAYSHALTNMYDGVGVPGNFNNASDPLGVAAERQVAFLYRRGDFKAFPEKVVLELDASPAALRTNIVSQLIPTWRAALSYRARTSVAFADQPTPGAHRFSLLDWSESENQPIEIAQPIGLNIDREKGTVQVDTPRFCGVAVSDGTLAAGVLSADVVKGGEMTVLSAASLDNLPLVASRHILVSHLTDVQASGRRYYDATRRLLLTAGKEPLLVRDGKVRVTLKSGGGAFTLYPLLSNGRRLAARPCTYQNGVLSFDVTTRSERGAILYWELVGE